MNSYTTMVPLKEFALYTTIFSITKVVVTIMFRLVLLERVTQSNYSAGELSSAWTSGFPLTLGVSNGVCRANLIFSKEIVESTTINMHAPLRQLRV